MAHKKAAGSTRNGRDSESKRLGVKRFGGETVSAGDEELEASYLLLVETWLDRMEAAVNSL